MSDAITAAGVATGLEILDGVYQYLKKRGTWDKVRDFFLRTKTYNVLVLGPSGAGKTSLFNFLQGLNPYVPRELRTERVKRVEGRLGDSLFSFTDTPGEELHEAKRKEGIKNAAAQTPLGIINVCCFGYHEGAAATDDAIAGRAAKPEFLEDRRRVEMDLLSEWTDLLCGRGGAAKWVMTAVSKADLWWIDAPELEQPVIQYYRSGTHFQALGPATEGPHVVVPYSSLNQPFFGQVPMSGWYSDNLRDNHRKKLVATLLELASG